MLGNSDDIRDSPAYKSIEDLPEEVLEIIFMKLSPYRDLKSASLVCSSWHKLVKVVLRKLHQNFINSVSSSKLQWSLVRPEPGSRITERYSHCCCYYDKSLYIFGGCTVTNTTLNDLWRFDLATREWIRPLATGTYPFPKACASMVVYKDSLVLFGGWSHPTPFPLHQAARFFSELHIYKPSTNRWSHITTLSHQSPQPMAGHSASVVGDSMVVFGGSQVPGIRTNEVWVFDFEGNAWRLPKIGFRRPCPRYGQTQVTIDDNHVLILGGCGGESPNKVFNDCWLLTIGDEEWTWDMIQLTNTESAPSQMWCHSACKVSNMVVTVSKAVKTPPRTVPVSPRAVPPSRIWVPPVENVAAYSVSTSRQPASPELQPLKSRYQSVSKYHLPTEAINTVVPSSQPVVPSQQTERSGDRSLTSGMAEKQVESDSRNLDELPLRKDSLGTSSSQRQLVSQPVSDEPQAGPSDLSLSHSTGQSHDSASNHSQAISQPVQVEPETGTSNLRPGQPCVRPNAMKNREKQLEALLKYEKRLRQHEAMASPEADNSPPRLSQNLHNIRPQATSAVHSVNSSMAVHVLDISRVVDHGTASWRKVNFDNIIGAPDETVFYSLVEGRGELLMFGGIERDIHSLQRGPGIKSMSVKNTLYVLSPLQELL